MSSQISNSRWHGWIAVLGCGLALGCTTVPPEPVPVPSPKVTRITTLKQLGFAPGSDGWELNLGVKLLFDLDVDALSDDGLASVSEVARTLRSLGIERIRIEGHTDSVGTAKYNAGLSQRRADSVARQLVKIGWPDDAIERRGFGADKPIADNATAAGRSQNRRVVIAVQVD